MPKTRAEMTQEELQAVRAADAERKQRQRDKQKKAKKAVEPEIEAPAVEPEAPVSTARWSINREEKPEQWTHLQQRWSENQSDIRSLQAITDNLRAGKEPMDGLDISDEGIPYPDERYQNQPQLQHLLDVAACAMLTIKERDFESTNNPEYREFGIEGLRIPFLVWLSFAANAARYIVQEMPDYTRDEVARFVVTASPWAHKCRGCGKVDLLDKQVFDYHCEACEAKRNERAERAFSEIFQNKVERRSEENRNTLFDQWGRAK